MGVVWTIQLKGDAWGQQKWPSLGTHKDSGEKSNAYITMLLKASNLAQWHSHSLREISLILLNDNEHWDTVG